METRHDRHMQFTSPPFTTSTHVCCKWCGRSAGDVDTTDIDASMAWLERGKLCPACYADAEMVRAWIEAPSLEEV